MHGKSKQIVNFQYVLDMLETMSSLISTRHGHETVLLLSPRQFSILQISQYSNYPRTIEVMKWSYIRLDGKLFIVLSLLLSSSLVVLD